jgi:integrase
MSVSNHNYPDRSTSSCDPCEGVKDDCFHVEGKHARRFYADLNELRQHRLKAAGGKIFKRARSPYWQLRYLVNGKLRDESTQIPLKNRRDAERLLAHKVYEASAGLLPGTATFEQLLGLVLDDAKVRGLKSLGRLERAAKALRAKLAGHRAEQIDRRAWLRYATDRKAEGIANDTIHFELWVARRAYVVARAAGMLRMVPDMPRMKQHVRQGFVTPEQWRDIRSRLRPELADAGDFALLTGAREMEVFGLPWSDVDREQQVIHLRATKTGQPRARSL